MKVSESWTEQEQQITKDVENLVGKNKLDGIFCVAGGWAGGNAASEGIYINRTFHFQLHHLLQSVCCVCVRSGFKDLKNSTCSSLLAGSY